jgi:hypothetical protein
MTSVPVARRDALRRWQLLRSRDPDSRIRPRAALALLAVKGANIRVASPWGEGWEDWRHDLLVPLPRLAGSTRGACA